jgi:hypothetical protein
MHPHENDQPYEWEYVHDFLKRIITIIFLISSCGLPWLKVEALKLQKIYQFNTKFWNASSLIL